MKQHHISKKITTLLFYYYYTTYKVNANVSQTPCKLFEGCFCATKSEITYEYVCSDFVAYHKNAKELEVKCNTHQTSTNQIDQTFMKINSPDIQKITATKCSPYKMFNNFNTFAYLTTLVMGEVNEFNGLVQIIPPNVRRLTEFEISSSRIVLTENTFNSSPAVRKLKLNQNALQELPQNIFRNLTQLNHLDLSNNEISSLPDAVFSGLRSLKYLILRLNKLTEISGTLLYDLQHLEEIDLSYNNIIGIHIEAFQRAVNLKVVDLGYNFVDVDGFSPFYSNLNLEKINLSHNKISHMVNDLVVNKIYLQELDLGFNEIAYIELSNLLTVSQSPTINLQNNNITSINFTNTDVIEELSSLINDDLPTGYSAMATIVLNDNPIACDCSLLNFIKYLNSKKTKMQFKISKAKCANPQKLKNVPLSSLKLEDLHCELEKTKCPNACHCNFRPWDKTVIIDCARKNLTKVPVLQLSEISSVSKIEVRLEGNVLSNGPQDGMGYDNVTKLMMSQNKIQDVTWLPYNLEILDVEHNNISHLSNEILLQLTSPTIRSLTLGNNPWNCDCAALSFSTFLIREFTSKQIDINNIQCSSKTRKLLVYLNSEDICSISSSNVSIIALIASLVVLGLSGVVIIVMIRKSRRNMGPKRSRMI